MIKTSARLSGNLAKGLDAFDKKVKDSIIFTGAAAGARFLYAEVKANTSPARMNKTQGRRSKGRQPGTLHAAVYRKYSPEKSPDGVKTYHISVNKGKAPHWFLVEYGSSRAPATPYLRPAAERIPDAIKVAKDAMRKRLSEGR